MLLWNIFTLLFWVITTFHFFHLIWDLIAMLLWNIFTLLFWVITTFLPGRWDATKLENFLISIITYGFRNRSAFLMVDIFLHLLRLRSFFKLTYLLVFIMTVLPFNWNRNHFS